MYMCIRHKKYARLENGHQIHSGKLKLESLQVYKSLSRYPVVFTLCKVFGQIFHEVVYKLNSKKKFNYVKFTTLDDEHYSQFLGSEMYE